MSYKVSCIELDGPWEGHEDCRSEVIGGFTVGPFDTLDEAKQELDNILQTEHHVDGVVINSDTDQRMTYLHGSYLF